MHLRPRRGARGAVGARPASRGFIRMADVLGLSDTDLMKSDAMTDRLLVLVRHGESEWNLKNLFTGWKDPDLTEKGIARRARPAASSRRRASASTSASPRR